MYSLERKVLLFAMQGAKNVFPNEFVALFRKTKSGHGVIIPPFSEYGRDFSSFDKWALPPLEIVGSFHSHPSGAGEPSPQDLAFFSKTADFNIIAFPPFGVNSFKAFSSDGKRVKLKIT